MLLKIFHRNWIESNILDTFGYGISSMDATTPSLCTSDGTTDIIPSGPNSESFLILNVVDEATKTITIGEFNTNDYNLARESAGYICERDELWGCPNDYFMVGFIIYKIG